MHTLALLFTPAIPGSLPGSQGSGTGTDDCVQHPGTWQWTGICHADSAQQEAGWAGLAPRTIIDTTSGFGTVGACQNLRGEKGLFWFWFWFGGYWGLNSGPHTC
jgi:hypothetical protein